MELQTDIIAPTGDFFLRISASTPPSNPVFWAAANRSWIEEQLMKFGVLLLRGFGVNPEQFGDVVSALSPPRSRLEYVGGIVPRSKLRDGVYTTTAFPNHAKLVQHQEMAYYRWWPQKLYFYCEIACEQGGETPVSSVRHFGARLDPKVFARFREKKVMYTRNYVSENDPSAHPAVPTWQKAYDTSERTEVEAFCRKNSIECSWSPRGGLRTRQVSQGVTQHAKSGEDVWFNQVSSINMYSGSPNFVAPSLRSLHLPKAELVRISSMTPDELPYSALYGDGTPIEHSVQDEVAGLFEQGEIIEPWQTGDVMIVDNLLAAHGRNPFSGQRRIVVSLTEPGGDVQNCPW